MDTVEKIELNILSEISKISNSGADLSQKLHRIVEVVARGMGRDGASVFLIDSSGRNVTLAAAIGLNQESVGKLSFPVGMGIAGWVAEQKVPLALEDPYSDPRFQYVPESGIEKFRSLLAAPIQDEDRCLGVIFVLSSSVWSATSSDIMLLTTTANQISGVIRNAQLFQNTQERLSELSTIYEIGKALTSTLDVDQLLSLIARNSTQALHAKSCAIRLLNRPGKNVLYTTRSLGPADDAVKEMDTRLGDLVTAQLLQDRKPLLVKDVTLAPLFRDVPGLSAGSLMGVQLIFHDSVIGVISLYDKQEGLSFDEDDLQFLTTIASSAAVAVENAVMYERMQDFATEARRRAEELSILYDIGTAMSTTLNLDRLLRIIMTAATMGGSGLGFNRAILLLTNERTNTLQGMMGVGPTSWEEAGRAWGEVLGKHRNLLEWIQTGELFSNRDSELNTLARSIRVQLAPGDSVLALTVLNKQPYNIVDAPASPLVNKELRERLKVQSFATVPLIAKDRVIGVIYVDNMFNQRPIMDNDIRFLTMFAHQAALAIENAIIHSNLETLNKDLRSMHEQLVQSEKMAALGAMMAEITHEIRNPLVSIGGFTRRLAKKIQDPEEKKYIDIIMSEVTRLESIIHDNLSYIKEMSPHLAEVDLNNLVSDTLMLYEDELAQHGIKLERTLSPTHPLLMLDTQQIKQAIINIIKNAIEAMTTGGVLGVTTFDLPETQEAALEISDTGPGIPAKVMHNIFNPFYTTKTLGTGLGLPITSRIIKAHHGRIEVRNRDAGGAIFTIRLPYRPDTDLHHQQ